MAMNLETKTNILSPRSRDQDRDLGSKVSTWRPRPWQYGLNTETKICQGLETKTETLAVRSRLGDQDLG